ncbi:hypothetical protein GA0115240_168419 [Streptomyces sp. DvalAA-14]|uniref:hypothetical protein n=1 Tax=unclassified Streptomyces TaxID=2593676 RepID=UPI00081B2A60|nr:MULTISPECIES: hypothetical protein [unclassified Streptomyces]MYS24745.1 hypothetical protein [Streptomyces sp. SID4948]SCE48979.1 hypothetical protein GA0115240_168419 [Streptomyces sp. DvalAA-14]
MDIVWLWIMLGSGCVVVGLGIYTLRTGRNGVLPRAAVGQIMVGVGLVLDPLPWLAGWSSRSAAAVAGVAFVCVIIPGVVLQIPFERLRRARPPVE